MRREGPDSVPPLQIDQVLVAFSRCVQQMSGHAAEINTQWKATTEALHVVVNSYCIRPSLVSVLKWVDSRNAVRLDLPNLLDALPEIMQKSTDGLVKYFSAYGKLEEALNRVEQSRRDGAEPLGSKSDFDIALFGMLHFDTAVIRYRACLLIAAWWTVDRIMVNDATMSSTPLRVLFWKEKGFLLKYCGMRTPPWLWNYEHQILTRRDR
ncbi:hypothetical protein FB45DRAFT_949246 [Roridomyces roridus]|uniref:Uncharacterized protein n=1 Tax=Roridomyces roridus TaxID=1738132 RepID=A0AAD7FA81_9AGAR|nr:hypothetical protein FB45DRAFT_949246 [Roridomyces roridus]